MLVLHALWSRDKHLALWCEDTDQPAALSAAVAPGKVAQHPFALELKGLRFPTRLFGGKGYRFELGATVVELPSAPAAPLPSPSLADQEFGETINGTPARLQPWRVQVPIIDADSASAHLLPLARADVLFDLALDLGSQQVAVPVAVEWVE